ncbi:MAG: hypothetical protein NC087_05175 [Anaeroplasma bactoclasticum]|nr:hypothetical protein [Anaeroplasma bactoclasticum]
MALVTKTQIKKRVKSLLEKLESIRDELDDLQTDVDMESADIEPYAGKDELTAAQEERQEWLDGVSTELGYIIEVIDATELVDYVEE